MLQFFVSSVIFIGSIAVICSVMHSVIQGASKFKNLSAIAKGQTLTTARFQVDVSIGNPQPVLGHVIRPKVFETTRHNIRSHTRIESLSEAA